MHDERHGSIGRARGWNALCLVAGLLVACTSVDDDGGAVEDLGVVTQESCGCGAKIASLDSVPAYSNGGSTGTGNNCNGEYYWGGRYQCVEYARRYVCERTRWGTGPTDCVMIPSLVASLGDGAPAGSAI